MDHCFVHRQTEQLIPAVQITSPEAFGTFGLKSTKGKGVFDSKTVLLLRALE
jgi:hypothetical protein